MGDPHVEQPLALPGSAKKFFGHYCHYCHYYDYYDY